MKRETKTLLAGLTMLLTLIMTGQTGWALSLSFNPATQSGEIGDSFAVDLVIAGLDQSDLGTFDLAVNYNSSVLTFDSYLLGAGLGDISLSEAMDLSAGDLGGGTINLAELSLLADLSFQADSFTLATLLFDGAALGTSPLTLSDVILGDDLGNPLEATLENGSITVRSENGVVPEPATMLLVGTGLAGIARIRRRLLK